MEAKFLQGMGLAAKRGHALRRPDGGVGAGSECVDRSLAEGELIAERAQEAGLEAKHKGILIDSCREGDIVIAPDGICGNLIYRTLLLLCTSSVLLRACAGTRVYRGLQPDQRRVRRAHSKRNP
ncbi:MAG: hypothetical protein NTY37_11725 [Methanothrix sp.]|nr:hypothetical protein [Methanothrix sp.]